MTCTCDTLYNTIISFRLWPLIIFPPGNLFYIFSLAARYVVPQHVAVSTANCLTTLPALSYLTSYRQRLQPGKLVIPGRGKWKRSFKARVSADSHRSFVTKITVLEMPSTSRFVFPDNVTCSPKDIIFSTKILVQASRGSPLSSCAIPHQTRPNRFRLAW